MTTDSIRSSDKEAAAGFDSRTELILGSEPPDYFDSDYANKGAYVIEEDGGDENTSEDSEDDPWVVNNLVVKSVPWAELSPSGRVKRLLWNYFFRQILMLLLLYSFFISLDFMSSAFRLIAGRATGQVLQQNEVLRNPVAGLLIGMIVTVLLQSSSTTTSIIVSMVGSGLFDVSIAIPIVMGANIGTSVTNTIVSMTQSADRDQFRRAFGGATVHDMFNILSVVILLPVEILVGAITGKGYLEWLSEKVVEAMPIPENFENQCMLKCITEPVSHYFIKVDKNAIIDIAKEENSTTDTLIHLFCGENSVKYNETYDITEKEKCPFIFMSVAGVWPDWVIGIIMLVLSLVLLCTCLILLVKLLNSALQGPIALVLKRFFNSNMPGEVGRCFTGYIAIVIGAMGTMAVQSSSVFTSTITPLVGIGVITLDRMYPLTLGSNIGTTITSILSSLAQDGDKFKPSLQLSMCHLFFNISGILLFYPIPLTRRIPINLAKKLGNTTAKYRWFAMLYLLFAFFLIPGALFGLSFINQWVVVAVVLFMIISAIIIAVISTLQSKKPACLPRILRSWNFLPLCCHSLKPLNIVMTACFNKCGCCQKLRAEDVAPDVENSIPEKTTLKLDTHL